MESFQSVIVPKKQIACVFTFEKSTLCNQSSGRVDRNEIVNFLQSKNRQSIALWVWNRHLGWIYQRWCPLVELGVVLHDDDARDRDGKPGQFRYRKQLFMRLFQFISVYLKYDIEEGLWENEIFWIIQAEGKFVLQFKFDYIVTK